MHITKMYISSVMLIILWRVINRQTGNISSTAHFQVNKTFFYLKFINYHLLIYGKVANFSFASTIINFYYLDHSS